MVVENFLCYIEQRKDLRIANGVVNILALLASTDDASISEHRKLLRQSALLDVEPAAEVVDPGFAATELVENADAKRVRQCLEKLRLELARLNHCSLIFAYDDIVVNRILKNWPGHLFLTPAVPADHWPAADEEIVPPRKRVEASLLRRRSEGAGARREPSSPAPRSGPRTFASWSATALTGS